MCSNTNRHTLLAVLAIWLAGSSAGISQEPRSPSVLREVEAGPTRAFALVSDRTPWILFVGRDRRAAVELVNQGTLSWTPDSRISVSYSLFKRDGTKVEEGGGVRTPLRRAVAPGQPVSVRAKIRPPKEAGIYILRWDMVEEHVQWFSDSIFHPKFERTVLVLPRVEYWLGCLLPAVAAMLTLVGALLLRRRSRGSPLYRLVAAGDLIWCCLAIVGIPHLLYLEMGLIVADQAIWMTLSAVALGLVALAFLPRRIRPLLCWLAVAMASLVVWTQILHFRFFQDVLSVTALLAAGQTGELGASVAELVSPVDWFLLLDLLVALPMVLLLRVMRPQIQGRRKLLRAGLAIVLVLAAVAGLWRMWRLSDWEETGKRGPKARTVRAIKGHGLYGYVYQDVFTQIRRQWLRPPLAAEELAGLEKWYLERAGLRSGQGPLFGVARGMNLLAIQVESMQQFVLDLQVEGQHITPNLARLRERALVFDALQDQTGNGRSSAGEFVSWTSIVPVANSVAHEFPANHYLTPAHALARSGYHVISAMPFTRSFWNRHQTYPAYGFSRGLFDTDFKPGQRVGWGLSDLDFVRQMVPKLKALPRPFCAWLTTLSLHYPYDQFPEELKQLDLGELEGTSLGNYLHGMNLFDRAFGELMRWLSDSDIAEETVVVLWGDHDSGLIRRESSPESLGLTGSWPDFFVWDRVPFMIWLPGAESPRDRFDQQAGQVDIAPTLLALFGIDPAAYAFVGRNLLGGAESKEIVVNPNGNWIGSEYLFLDPGERLEEGSCWSLAERRRVSVARCRAGYAEAQRQIKISETILLYDLQQELSLRLAAILGEGTESASEAEP